MSWAAKKTLAGLLLAAAAAAALAQPLPLHGVALVDQQGRAIEAASLRGQVTLLNFVYTGCSSTCPTQTRELAELRRALPAPVRQRAQFLSVSVDPVNDKPRTLREFAQRLGADQPGWRFATGAVPEVEALIARMQIFDARKSAPQPADHRSSLYLFDARGALVQRFAGVPVDQRRLGDEITRLVQAAP